MLLLSQFTGRTNPWLYFTFDHVLLLLFCYWMNIEMKTKTQLLAHVKLNKERKRNNIKLVFSYDCYWVRKWRSRKREIKSDREGERREWLTRQDETRRNKCWGKYNFFFVCNWVSSVNWRAFSMWLFWHFPSLFATFTTSICNHTIHSTATHFNSHWKY